MAKPEWGVKRICPSCGARYYDMRKDPPVCPSCGAQFDPEALLKSRKARPAPADDTKKVAAVTEDEDTENEAEESDTPELEDVEDDMSVEDIEETDDTADDEDDVLIEDTSELGEDDMDEVVDVEGEDEEER
ncbi:TIGR02300 family protein [Azospirillum largimobile]